MLPDGLLLPAVGLAGELVVGLLVGLVVELPAGLLVGPLVEPCDPPNP